MRSSLTHNVSLHLHMRRDICTHRCCSVATDADTQWKEKNEIDRETTPPRHTTHPSPPPQKTHTPHTTHTQRTQHAHTTHTQRTQHAHTTHTAHTQHTQHTHNTHTQHPQHRHITKNHAHHTSIPIVVVFLMTLDKLPIALTSLASFWPVSFRW